MDQPHEYSHFGAMLHDALEERGHTLEEWGERVGMSRGHVSRLCAGQRRPPIDQMPVWAQALHLDGAYRQRFLDLAALAHLPEGVQGRFVGLLNSVHEARELRDRLRHILERR